MRIVVCVTCVRDPRVIDDLAATGHLVIDEAGVAVQADFADMVLNPFDEQALGAALRLKGMAAPSMVTAVSVDCAAPHAVFQRAFELGADDGWAIESGLTRPSARSTSELLAAVVRHFGDADVILFGRETSDGGQGVVGPLVAADLDIAFLGSVRDLQLVGSSVLRATRVSGEGHDDQVETDIPAVAVVSDDMWDAPVPRALDILAARRRSVFQVRPADVGVDQPRLERHADEMRLVALGVQRRVTACEFLEGGTPDAVAQELVRRLDLAGRRR